MEVIWRFVTDNQQVLGWLGGGAPVVAGGIWKVAKFFQKRKAETSALKEGLAAEISAYSSDIINFVSIWNRYAARPVEQALEPLFNHPSFPEFREPLFYKTNIEKIGHLPRSVTSPLVEFYALLLYFNDSVNKEQTAPDIVTRLRIMSANMANALPILTRGRR